MSDIFTLTTTVDSDRTSEELRLHSMRVALNEIARYTPTVDQNPWEVISHLKDLAGKALLEDTVESISPSLPSTETEVRFSAQWQEFFDNAKANRTPKHPLSYKSVHGCCPARSGHETEEGPHKTYLLEGRAIPVSPREGKTLVIFLEPENKTEAEDPKQ